MVRIVHIVVDHGGSAAFEILVALTLTGVVALAINSAYDSQEQGMPDLDVTPLLQQRAKATTDALVEHIQVAGNSIPLGLAALTGENSNPDKIQVVYRTDSCRPTLIAPMTSVSAPLECNAGNDCIRPGSLMYIVLPKSTVGEWFEAATVDSEFGSELIAHRALRRTYPIGAELIPLTQASFYVDRYRADGPALMVKVIGRPALVYAEDVSDLQFQYRFKDGQVKNEPTPWADVREVMVAVTVDMPSELARFGDNRTGRAKSVLSRATVVPAFQVGSMLHKDGGDHVQNVERKTEAGTL